MYNRLNNLFLKKKTQLNQFKNNNLFRYNFGGKNFKTTKDFPQEQLKKDLDFYSLKTIFSL